jgi:hypothetical protein
VEEGGEVQHLRAVELLHELRQERVLVVEARDAEAPQVADHHEDVLVHGVDVEEVVLHLPHDAAEHREIAPEHAVAAHAPQRPREALAPHDLHEAAAVLARLAEALVDVRQRARQGA